MGGPLGTTPEVTAADQRERGVAAHVQSITDGGGDGKRAKRANGTCMRAKIGGGPGISGWIGGDGGVHGR